MSKSSHTPGPWIWRWKSGSLHQVGNPPYRYGDSILYPTGLDSDLQISEADAHLIASAPDLYAACSSFDDMAMFTENADDEDVVVVTLGTVRKIRAALAKARGEA